MVVRSFGASVPWHLLSLREKVPLDTLLDMKPLSAGFIRQHILIARLLYFVTWVTEGST